jgi:GMP synthase (glutamine-hydrolysing)
VPQPHRCRRLLLYKTGQTDPALTREIGDYEAWFARVVGPDVTLELHLAFDRPDRALAGYDGVVITGSPRSLVTPEPWMDGAAAFVRRAAEMGVPVLGVCFGHQLIGYAYGSRVRQNPNGWEVGTSEIELTDEGRDDALFSGLGQRLHVNQSHRDEIEALAPGMVVLARSSHTTAQAIAVGSHVRGVQFHPEISGSIIRRLIGHRRALLMEDFERRGCAARVAALEEAASDTPAAEQVLRNFVSAFVRVA